MGNFFRPEGDLKFWLEGTLPTQTILAVWGFECQVDHVDMGFGFSLQRRPVTSHSITAPRKESVLCLYQDNMPTLMLSDEDSRATAIQQGNIALFDQFAQFPDHALSPLLVVYPRCEIGTHKFGVNDVFSKENGSLSNVGLFLITSKLCQGTASWDPDSHSLLLVFQGPTEATTLLADIWKSVLSEEILKHCEFVSSIGQGHQCVFQPGMAPGTVTLAIPCSLVNSTECNSGVLKVARLVALSPGHC